MKNMKNMKNMKKRQLPHIRRQQLIEAAYEVSASIGFFEIGVRDVAYFMGTSPSLIYHYFKNFDSLKKEVIERAKRKNFKKILSQINWREN